MTSVYDQMQSKEIFHLEFLRFLSGKVKTKYFSLKGGANLRFFFRSIRYSEDMDLDVSGVGVTALKDIVMKIFQAPYFQDSLTQFGIERVVPPDIIKAKQTETTQRFKIHLITFAGEDLFTKVEFSRRGFKGNIVVQPVSNAVLRSYKLSPLVVPHYDIQSSAMQKIEALAARAVIQARDIFDLYILSSQFDSVQLKEIKIKSSRLTKAHENVFEVNFEKFRDTVISYFSAEDQAVYNSASLWDEIKLKVSGFIEELRRVNA